MVLGFDSQIFFSCFRESDEEQSPLPGSSATQQGTHHMDMSARRFGISSHFPECERAVKEPSQHQGTPGRHVALGSQSMRTLSPRVSLPRKGILRGVGRGIMKSMRPRIDKSCEVRGDFQSESKLRKQQALLR